MPSAKNADTLNGPRSAALPREYAVRRVTLLDLRAMHRLEHLIFPRDAYTYFDLTLLLLLPGAVNLKVTAPDGTLAGFVSGMRALNPRRGWIVTLGIDPAHQRRGLGRHLLTTCEQRLKRPCIRLTVRAGNTPAITLYKHSGYQLIRRKPGYYLDGETGLIMEKWRGG
ncbi:MAG: GNAT family N-acetyltransferase [Anaerolineae bacterium]|nr:GNAT family N-acetyltransferase [Anaerolineae bacterium]